MDIPNNPSQEYLDAMRTLLAQTSVFGPGGPLR